MPTAPRQTKRISRIEPLVDYSQFQVLTSNHHITNLESIATRKQRLQLAKEQKKIEKELNKAQKFKEKELNNIKKAKEQEAKKEAKK